MRAGYIDQVELFVRTAAPEGGAPAPRATYAVVFSTPVLLDEAADAALQLFRAERSQDFADLLEITVRAGDIAFHPRPDPVPTAVRGTVTRVG